MSAELVHQLGHVFRLRPGDGVILFDGSGRDYTCVIARFVGDDGVVFGAPQAARSRFMPEREIALFAAVVKKDNFEFIVEKTTELGATHIVPVLAERSEKKALNVARLKKIAIEASEQSGRGNVPAIYGIIGFEAALGQATDMRSIAFHTDGEPLSSADLASKGKPLGIFIGPEGGWSPSEVASFHKNKIAVRCLGPQILRAETAVISALSRVVFD